MGIKQTTCKTPTAPQPLAEDTAEEPSKKHPATTLAQVHRDNHNKLNKEISM
ncbi:MAG: hypothetical protein QXT27_04230 [Pyrobaculum sp.]